MNSEIVVRACPPFAVLSKLSKGSVIGVDAILECFGQRITSWAERSIDIWDTPNI